MKKMKKILLLLLFTIASYGQAVFDEGIQITNTESTTATKVNVQEANGKVNTKTINTAFNKNFGLNTGDVVGANTLLNQYSTTPVDWTATTFASGQVVFYGGKQWIAKIATVAGDVPAVSSKWEEITFEALANKTVTVDQTIIDGSTNAVSGNAVFDGLALKSNIVHTHVASQITDLSKASVGLGNVDNTSDLLKPISTATQTALNAKANISGQVFTGAISATNLSGNNTGDNAPNSLYSGLVTNATHTGEVTGSTALTITNGAVTNAKLANVATATIKGRVAAGSGIVEDLTASQVRTLLNVADGANNYVHPANHLASIITQDASNRFVTDTEKSAWNAKESAIASGTISQYWRGDKTWQEFPTIQTIDNIPTDGSNNAVSSNGVFDALATKAPISSVHNPVTLGTANGLSLSTQQLSLGLASSGVTGALSGTDWNTFNSKFNTPTGLTTNYLPKWNGSGFGNSNIFDNGTNVGIGTNALIAKFQVALGNDKNIGFYEDGEAGISSFTDGAISNAPLAFNATEYIFKIRGVAKAKILNNGNLLVNTATDDLTNKLQVNGTISASPATTANQVVVKSQLDAVAARPYKVYTAVLTQQNTDAPSAVVLENTLGGTVVWTRNVTGNYYGTLNSAFPIQNKIALFQGGGMSGILPLKIIRVQYLNSNTIQIITQQATDGALVDNSLANTSIEIRVYN